MLTFDLITCNCMWHVVKSLIMVCTCLLMVTSHYFLPFCLVSAIFSKIHRTVCKLMEFALREATEAVTSVSL